MDLNHEEKLIALRGFSDELSKEAGLGREVAVNFGKAKRAIKAGYSSARSDKQLGIAMSVGRKGSKTEKDLLALGQHVGKHRTAYAVGGTAATAVGGTALIMKD